MALHFSFLRVSQKINLPLLISYIQNLNVFAFIDGELVSISCSTSFQFGSLQILATPLGYLII